MCCKLREAAWCLVDSPSSSSASETKRKAPLFAAGSPRPDRRPPSTPFTPLLESLHNLSGLQEVVPCLDPRRRFFVLHLLQLRDVSNKRFLVLLLHLQLVSEHLAFS